MRPLAHAAPGPALTPPTCAPGIFGFLLNAFDWFVMWPDIYDENRTQEELDRIASGEAMYGPGFLESASGAEDFEHLDKERQRWALRITFTVFVRCPRIELCARASAPH